MPRKIFPSNQFVEFEAKFSSIDFTKKSIQKYAVCSIIDLTEKTRFFNFNVTAKEFQFISIHQVLIHICDKQSFKICFINAATVFGLGYELWRMP